jgi:hypothetical protein
MLIMQGKRDYQVTTRDYEGWQKALSTRKNVTFKLYDKLNHLFMEGPGEKATPDEYSQAGHIPDYVISDIADWVKKQP